MYTLAQQSLIIQISFRNIDSKLAHLTQSQQHDLKELFSEYEQLFSDVPSRTDTIIHDVNVGDAQPIMQQPYRLNHQKEEYLKNEVQYLLDNYFIETSQCNWSLPCLLVPKPDQSYRMCTDFRKLNSVTKTDTVPIPRIDDWINKVGKAKYVTKIDLLKGFYQLASGFSTRQILLLCVNGVILLVVEK